MRAWQTVTTGLPLDALTLNEHAPPPQPIPGSVLIDVIAAGIGLPDVFMCRGKYPLAPKSFPFTQGQEAVGRIAGWGEGVQNRRIGDRVMGATHFFTGHGGFADQCLVLDDFCLPVPGEMTDAEAASFLIAFHTAYISLVTRGAVEAGETLLVMGGAGGTGQAAIQIGKTIGAKVIATARGRDRARFCLALGADSVIDHQREDMADSVRKATGGRGADAIFDPVGGDAFSAATKCVAPGGRILAIGFASGSWGEADTSHMVSNNYSVVGAIPTHYDRSFKEQIHESLLTWWSQGKLRPHIDSLVPFETLPVALQRLADGEVKGRLALAVDPRATTPG